MIDFNDGVLERININDNTLIYNPLFDHYPKPAKGIQLDMEQYLSIKEARYSRINNNLIKRQLSLEGVLSEEIITSNEYNPYHKNEGISYKPNQSFKAKTHQLTPFQSYKLKLVKFNTALRKKARNNSQREIFFNCKASSPNASHRIEIDNNNQIYHFNDFPPLKSKPIESQRKQLVQSLSQAYFTHLDLHKVREFPMKSKEKFLHQDYLMKMSSSIPFYITPFASTKMFHNHHNSITISRLKGKKQKMTIHRNASVQKT